MLAHRPALTLAATLTLALAIGANTAIRACRAARVEPAVTLRSP